MDGRTLSVSRLASVFGLNLDAVIRNGSMQLSPESAFTLQAGNRWIFEGSLQQLSELPSANELVLEKDSLRVKRLVSADIDLVEARLSPRSRLIRQTLMQMGFPQSCAVVVLAILREEGLRSLEIETQHLPDLGKLESEEIGLLEKAYHLINLKAIFLIAGMLPMGLAIEQTGTAQCLVSGKVGIIGDMGPLAVVRMIMLVIEPF